jgi:CubicO group peptidase (beta-lactamase class C family)
LKKKESKRPPLLPLLFLLILFGCSKDAQEPEYSYEEPVETNDGWETGSLQGVGMDVIIFEELARKINAGIYKEVHAIIVAKDNTLVFENYWSGHDFDMYDPDYHGDYIKFDINTRHNTHSTTKSFTSALIGIAIDQGIITSKDDCIFDYLSDRYDDLNSNGKENITIEHCLKMASGLEWNQWDVGISDQSDLLLFNKSADPIRYLLSKPVVFEPGTYFYYNGGTVDLLGMIIASATNGSVQSFSADYLFGPLGITNYNWVVLHPSNLTCCHGDVYITPRDMAKFGQLFLDEGKWQNQQIISTKWVNQSTQYHIDPGVESMDGYGYLWWLKNFEVNGTQYHSYQTSGWGGQEIYVFDELEMVVVFTGANYVTYNPCIEILRDYILPSLN